MSKKIVKPGQVVKGANSVFDAIAAAGKILNTQIEAVVSTATARENRAMNTIAKTLYDGTVTFAGTMNAIGEAFAEDLDSIKAAQGVVDSDIVAKANKVAGEYSEVKITAEPNFKEDPDGGTYDAETDAPVIDEAVSGISKARYDFIAAFAVAVKGIEDEEIVAEMKKLGKAAESSCNDFVAQIKSMGDLFEELGMDAASLQNKVSAASGASASKASAGEYKKVGKADL